MIIYITVHTEPYEGYNITGVYSTLKKARKHADDEDIFRWELDGKQIKDKPKKGGRSQLELNMPFLKTFTSEYLLKNLEAVEKGIKF